MFDDKSMHIMRMAGAGYCCTQIMVMLALDTMGRQNDDLVRAAGGLCHGLGGLEGPCGILAGGSMVIGLYLGKGNDDEQMDPLHEDLLGTFGEWFTARATELYSGISCMAVAGGESGQPDPNRCGPLLGEAFARVQDLLRENGIELTQGREVPFA